MQNGLVAKDRQEEKKRDKNNKQVSSKFFGKCYLTYLLSLSSYFSFPLPNAHILGASLCPGPMLTSLPPAFKGTGVQF